MFHNYIKTAVRSLMRHKFFSAINVFGLAVAMSICMGIIMLVADQMNYDRHNTKRDRIYRITTQEVDQHGTVTDNQVSASSVHDASARANGKLYWYRTGSAHYACFGNGWLESKIKM
jgi:putative ABC transport system permease protein